MRKLHICPPRHAERDSTRKHNFFFTHHVLIISYFYPPLYSGEATYTEELALGLMEKGWKVTLLLPGLTALRERSLPSWVILAEEPNFDRYKEFQKYQEALTKNFLRAAKESGLRDEWSLVHVQEWFGTRASVEIANALKIPLVKTIHFVPPERLLEEDPRWIASDELQRIACASATEIIAVSDHIRDAAISRYGVSENKFNLVHNGVSIDRLKDGTAQIHPDRLGACEKKQRLVVLSGRLVAQKGIDLLMRSIPLVRRQLDQVSWVICGGTARAELAIEEYRKLAFPDERSVKFTGHIHRIHALRFVRQADVIVAPSRFEPFGLSVLEAMLLERPLIVSGVGGHLDLVRDHSSGLVLPADDVGGGWHEVDPTDLATAQVALLTDKSTAASYGMNARLRADEHFSFERFIRGTAAVYTKARISLGIS